MSSIIGLLFCFLAYRNFKNYPKKFGFLLLKFYICKSYFLEKARKDKQLNQVEDLMTDKDLRNLYPNEVIELDNLFLKKEKEFDNFLKLKKIADSSKIKWVIILMLFIAISPLINPLIEPFSIQEYELWIGIGVIIFLSVFSIRENSIFNSCEENLKSYIRGYFKAKANELIANEQDETPLLKNKSKL